LVPQNAKPQVSPFWRLPEEAKINAPKNTPPEINLAQTLCNLDS
jgi:hypothetical protein